MSDSSEKHDVKHTFIDRIKALRKANSCRQSDVAAAINLTRQSYNHYESGKRQPDISTFALIADFFNVSADYLLGRTTTPKAENKKTPDANTSGKELFSDEEYSMLLQYRMLNDIEKADVRGYINGKVSSSHNSKVNELPCSAG